MNIRLNDTEQRLAQYIAKCRYSNNRDNGIENKKIGPQSNEQTDLDGIGAEIAFCKYFNIYPDLEIDHHPHEDGLLPNGLRVDIKQTPYKSGHLLTPVWKKEIATDVYALMIGKFPEYRYAGTITSDELFRDENIKDFGYGNTYAVKQEMLNI